MIEQLFSPELVHTLGWTLVHSLWQAAFFALALGGLLIGLRKYSARARYYLSIAVLGGFFLSVGLTFCNLYGSADVAVFIMQHPVDKTAFDAPATDATTPGNAPLSTRPAPAAAPSGGREVLAAARQTFLQRMSVYYNDHLPLIVTLWLLGVLVLQLRFIGQLAYLQRLKSYGTEAIPTRFAPLLRELEEKMGLKKAVRYLSSYRVKSPFTMGWLQPVVLFPTRLIEELNEPELRSIIAHELAHVKRHDFLVNLGQTMLCILFFYHPAVWWMSARIEDEREHCCDDLAVAVTGERVGYAKTLIQLKETDMAPQLAMAMKGGGFTARINRLLSGYLGTGTFGEGFTSAVIIFGIMALAISLSAEESGTDQLSGPFLTALFEEEKAHAVALENERRRRVESVELDERPERLERPERIERPERPERVERPEAPERPAPAEDPVTSTYFGVYPDSTAYFFFLSAINEGNVPLVRYFIDRGVDVNAVDEDGWTPLMVAASEDQVEIAHLLIEAGAEVNYVNAHGWTALVEAADEDALATANVLLASGAIVDIEGVYRSALAMAASEGHAEMIALLIGAGADPASLKGGNTPLLEAAEEGHLDIVKVLIDKGADAGARDGHGRTPLSYAAEEGQYSIVRYLLQAGADPNAMDEYGRTALSYAAEEGQGRIIGLLLEAGAKVDAKEERDEGRHIDVHVDQE